MTPILRARHYGCQFMFCFHQYGVFHFVWQESKIIYILPQCRVNCHQFLTVFSSSLIVKAKHLLSVAVVLHIYFIAFWWCNCMHCQSAWSKSPLRLKSLSSCTQNWYSGKHKKNELCPVSPAPTFEQLLSSLDKINLTLFKCTLRLFKLRSWCLKKILHLEQIDFKGQKT